MTEPSYDRYLTGCDRPPCKCEEEDGCDLGWVPGADDDGNACRQLCPCPHHGGKDASAAEAADRFLDEVRDGDRPRPAWWPR